MTGTKGLLRHSGFLRLWIGQSVSSVGDQVSHLALPLTAVAVLDATSEQMGILTAAERLPHLVFGLIAGVWVDRMRRKPILVASHVGRALLLATIPLAALAGVLHMEQLYLVGFLVASIGVVAMVADMSFLPALVGREHLVEANGKLTMSWSVAMAAGPGLAGHLVAWLTAPIAVAVDAVSFLFSAVCVGSIRVNEPPPDPEHREQSVVASVRAGLALVLGNPTLRAIVTCGATHNFFSTALVAVFVLYLKRDLDLSVVWLGWIFTAGGPGAFLGAAIAPYVARRVGVGPALVVAQGLTGAARLLIPLATGSITAMILTFMASEFLLGVARPIFNVNNVSLRQALAPLHMQGRMNASVRFLMWSVTPLGALAGGFAGGAFGLRPTLLVAAAGIAASTLFVLHPAVRSLREVPRNVE